MVGTIKTIPNRNNSSGHPGVYFRKDRNKWTASISINYKTVYLGEYSNIDEAIKVREDAVQKYKNNQINEIIPIKKYSHDEEWKLLSIKEKKRISQIKRREKNKEYSKEYIEKNKKKINTRTRNWNRKLKEEVFRAYGSVCQCCGESNLECLTIDHIFNDGKEHRKETGGCGRQTYAWLKKNGFPKDKYRLLCCNCNFALAHHGYCPHQSLKNDYNLDGY